MRSRGAGVKAAIGGEQRRATKGRARAGMSCSGPRGVIDGGRSPIWMNVPVFLRRLAWRLLGLTPSAGESGTPSSGDPWATIPQVWSGVACSAVRLDGPADLSAGVGTCAPILVDNGRRSRHRGLSAITFARRLASPSRVVDVGLAVLRFPPKWSASHMSTPSTAVAQRNRETSPRSRGFIGVSSRCGVVACRSATRVPVCCVMETRPGRV